MSHSYAPLGDTLSENESVQPRKILNSWKEIASYLGRGVRTVQRYEVQFGFPIHRATGGSRSSVMAFSDEVEAWLRRTPVQSQLVCYSNVIEMPNAGKKNQDGDMCPFCQGTGKARPLASEKTPARNSDLAFS